MILDGYICRLKKETGSTPCLVETSSTHSRVSCSTCEPSKLKKSGESVSFDLFLTRSEGSLMERSCSLTMVKALENPLTKVDMFPRAILKKTSLSPEFFVNSFEVSSMRSVNAWLSRGVFMRPKSAPLTDGDNESSQLTSTSCSTPLRLPEKQNSSTRTCHATFCRASQAKRSPVGCDGEDVYGHSLSQHESTSPKSASSVSQSPSPVRSRIISPIATATMRLDGEASLADYSSSINDRSAPPISTFGCDFSFDSRSPIAEHFPKIHENKVDQLHFNFYPPHLNPFPLEASEDERPSVHRNPVAESDVISRPVEEPLATLSESPEIPLELPVSSSASPVRSELYSLQVPSSIQKKLTPRPPFQVEVTERASGRKTLDANLKLPVPPKSSLSSEILSLHSSICRSSSVKHIEVGTSDIRRSLESKSMIVKRPAPPIPVYGKRTIKADSTEEFINYSELHEQLYLTNRRLVELEAKANRLQRKVDRAEINPNSATSLLEERRDTLRLRDTLSRKHTELLEKLLRQELEERHTNLEHELRLLLAKQDALKTQGDKDREKKLLHELLTTVNRRSELVDRVSDASEKNSSSTSSRVGIKHKRLICLKSLKHKLKTRRRNFREDKLPQPGHKT